MVETESSGRQRAHRGVSLQMACTCEDRFGSKCEELKTSIKSPLLPSKRTLERTSQLVAFVPQGDIGGAANSSGEMPRPTIKKLICTYGLAANQGPTRYERVRNLALILQWYSPSHGSRGSYV